MIDDLDGSILNLLQENARISQADIARAVGLTPSAVLERMRKLEARGAIRGYVALVDPQLDQIAHPAGGCLVARNDQLEGGIPFRERPAVLFIGDQPFLAASQVDSETLVHEAIAARYPQQTQQMGSYIYPTGELDTPEEDAEEEAIAQRIGPQKPWLSEMVIEDRGPR